MNHMQRFLRIVERHPEISKLVIIVPREFKFGQSFGNIIIQITGMEKRVTMLESRQKALEHYEQYQAGKANP